MIRGAEILEKAQRAPETLNTRERLILGIATINTVMTDETVVPEKRADLLKSAINLTRQNLIEIRTNPKFSEAERLGLASITFSEIDWGQMEPTEEVGILFAETMVTLFSGLETPIQQEMDRIWQDISRGNLEASALLMLLDAKEGSSPVEQIRHIQKKKKNSRLTPEQRRTVTFAWACHLATRVDDEQFAEMVEYFEAQDDMEAVEELSAVKLMQVFGKTTS
jgi:hypothetical protein